MTFLRIAPEAEEELAIPAEWYEEHRAALRAELIAEFDVSVVESQTRHSRLDTSLMRDAARSDFSEPHLLKLVLAEK